MTKDSTAVCQSFLPGQGTQRGSAWLSAPLENTPSLLETPKAMHSHKNGYSVRTVAVLRLPNAQASRLLRVLRSEAYGCVGI